MRTRTRMRIRIATIKITSMLITNEHLSASQPTEKKLPPRKALAAMLSKGTRILGKTS